MSLTRRQLAPALIGLSAKAGRRVTGGFVFESEVQGHRLRDHASFARPRQTIKAPLVIIGGGVAGLSAAWWLDRHGYRDFILLEMEKQTGGNARWGENEISRFPWAAHYLPVPGPQATYVRLLCEELGLLADGEWNERWLCHSPQERLFLYGRWQEGIEPHIGLTPEDVRQFDRFFARIQEFRESGRFTIPMQQGFERSTAAERALDRITMDEWMRREGFYSPHLRWLIDYSTRDDYATSLKAASAWAGIHYFASRPPEEPGPLTWPEGNGWIVHRLLGRLARFIRNEAMVCRVERARPGWRIFTEQALYEARMIVWAAPTWIASWILDPPPPRWVYHYAPWLVANLTLDHWPKERGVEVAWDNVIYDSPALGYVVATHQNLATFQPKTVWTFYWALSQGNAADQRRILLGGDWAWWVERIFHDLERAHPDIRDCVSHIDIFRIGHAMPRPVPGLVFHPERIRRTQPDRDFAWANCDLSGLSLFEEAQYRGIEAARHALRFFG
jgi:glycine/D-amino acid oxidase-like deaminating enzyme